MSRICRVYLIYLMMDSSIVHLVVTVQNKKIKKNTFQVLTAALRCCWGRGELLLHPENGTTTVTRNAVSPSPIDTTPQQQHSSVQNGSGVPKWVPRALVGGRVNAAGA